MSTSFKKSFKLIIDAAKRDMEYLAALEEKDILFTYNPGMRVIHEENAKLLEQFLNEYGWPMPSKYGHEVHYAAWLIAIHAISQPALLKRVLKILEDALAAGEPVANEYAKLSDRIGLYEGRGQTYGTQFFPSPDGWYARELVDLDHVNERRAALGLSTFEENKHEVGAGEGGYMNAEQRAENEKRFQAFLNEVGWRKQNSK